LRSMDENFESLSLAYGRRAVQKLIGTLSTDETKRENVNLALSKLDCLLSNQENKMQAISYEPPVMPVLTELLTADDAQTRDLSARIISSLSLVFQGRLQVRETGTVAPLTRLVGMDGVEVATASSAALLSISTSRDGCAALIEHEELLVPILTKALAHPIAVALNCLNTLANLLRQDMGVTTALTSDIVPQLRQMITPGESPLAVLIAALQATWNLANTADGKVALVDDAFLPILSKLTAAGAPKVRRLAAGCIMTITINKQGKLESLVCLEPLLELLLDASAAPFVEPGSIRSACLALKNSAEFPQARNLILRIAGAHKLDAQHLTDMVVGEMFDADDWPISKRYVDQWNRGSDKSAQITASRTWANASIE